jgi:hypothetical protein
MGFPEVQPVIVASHPRSGTHLLIDLLRRQFDACRSWKWPGERLDRLYCSIDELNADRGRLDEQTARRILSRTDRPLVKTHAWSGLQDTFLAPHHEGLPPDWAEWIDENGTVLYVHRDGRDVMCSYQMMRRRMDASPDESVGSFMRGTDPGQEENRVRRWARHVRAWTTTEDVHALSFESILNTPEAVIESLGERLGLDPEWRTPPLPERFSSIWESRWARLFSMRPESTAILGTGGKDWQKAFSADDRRFFHQEAGELLLDLGYVDSAAWVDSQSTDSVDPRSQKASR